jgi:hypothetical protein
MNKITFPLSLGKQGSAVSDLQAALLLLLERSVILPNDEGTRKELSANVQREQTTQTYGDATAKSVSIFQEQRNIQLSGNVYEFTANANALLSEFGVLDGQGNSWTEVVTVLNAQGHTLSEINLGTDHLANIDQKIGTLGNVPSLSLNMRGDAVKNLHAQLMSVGVRIWPF